ncbi:MAG: flavodoxin family protein [Bacillota bacterium]
MKKVLGLVISERRLGNSEILVKEIMGNVPEPCSREIIRLTELSLKPCKACYHCLQPGAYCKMNDDFNFVLDKIIQADALVIGMPVYFLGPPAAYKLLTDRMLGAGHRAGYTAGKPCLIVVPYGIRGWEGYTRSAAMVLPRLLQMKLVDYWSVPATLPGESLLNVENIRRAGELGANIFDLPAGRPEQTQCPNCGGDLFRLLPGGGAECPLCAAKFVFTAQDGNTVLTPSPDIKETRHHRFSAEGIDEHFNHWLVSMKEKYLKEREQLKKLQKPYLDKQWWVKP